MAQRMNFQQSVKERHQRVFSEEFKRQKVREIERKESKISDICRQYEVNRGSIRNWLLKYSSKYMKGVKTIVELESDTRKLLDLQAKIAELEQIIGQKQLMIEFQDKVIELAEETYGVDIKKKLLNKPSSISGTTGKS
jgi:transposase-like protein